MNDTTRLRRLFVTTVGLGFLLVWTSSGALAQQRQTADPEIWLAGGLVSGIVAGAITFVVCGLLIALAPDTTERVTDRARSEPGISFLIGLGAAILFAIATFILILTVIGILLAIPLVIMLLVISEFGYLAAGRAVVPEWATALLLAIAISAFAGGVPIIGGLIGFILGSIGIGAFIREYMSDDPQTEPTGPHNTLNNDDTGQYRA